MKKIVVVPYDHHWPDAFKAIRAEVLAALGTLAIGIEHVGSTSVENLWAKPIIDLDVILAGQSDLPAAIEKLKTIGYEHEGDLGIKGREAFRFDSKPHLMDHHLYVCPSDSPELKRHLTFRDYLRTHPDAVRQYSEIKQEAARLCPYDIDAYLDHKGVLIREIYDKCGL